MPSWVMLENIFQVPDTHLAQSNSSILLPIVLQMMATQSDEQGNVTSASEII